MNNLSLSVITLTYNSQRYLNECLDSIFIALQELDSSITFEHIVCDGGSDDKTIDIVTSHPLKSVLLKSPVSGLYPSLDYAIKMAKGKYISYVHSDDFVSNSFFQSLMKAISDSDGNSSKERIYPCTDVAFVDSESNILWYRRQPKIIKVFQKKVNLLFHPNCLFERDIELLFPYSENNLNEANLDWKHINMIIDNNIKFQRVTKSYYFFRIHFNSTTVKKIKFDSENRVGSIHKKLANIDLIELVARIYLYCHETQKIKRILQRFIMNKFSWNL